jgi:peptide/nickel transport system substrate-binding protein
MTPTGSIARRRLLQAGAALGLLGVAAPRLVWAAEGGVARIRVDADLQVLDPAFQRGGTEEMVINATLVTLTRLKETAAESWEPYAAETIEQVDDKTIRFVLREGLTWTNGHGPVTAEDVKYSFERVADPAKESPWAYQWELLDTVEVVDARTGVIRLKEPYAPLYFTSLPWYGGAIVCKAAVEAAGGRYTTDIPAQCGPYLLSKWEPKVAITLTRNPDWTGEAPAFDELRLIIVEDDKAAELAFEAHEVDYTRISVDSVPRYRATPPAGGSLIERSGVRYAWLGMNVDHPNLKDQRVRQAIQHAIDVDTILAGAYSGVAERATGTVPPGFLGHREKNLVAYDPQKARALLAEAGVGNGFATTITALAGTVEQSKAEIIQANLAEVGITAEITMHDEGTYWNLGLESQGEDWKDLQLTLMEFTGGTDPSENLVWFTPEQVGIWNWERWNNAEFGELYKAALTELDPAKRDAMYKRMQELMEESGAYVFLTHGLFAALHVSAHKPFIVPDGFLSLPRYAKA